MAVSRARCRLCSEEITFTTGNPIELGFHMIDRHSSGSVNQYSIQEEDKVCASRRQSQNVMPPPERKCQRIASTTERRTSPCRQNVQSAPRFRTRRRNTGLYKTTLETWTSGGCAMMCPCCKKQVKPLLRSQKNKVAYTSFGATFLLSCWPFCFLFPLQHKCSVELYCPTCKIKLGWYDTISGRYHTSCGDNVQKKSKKPCNACT